MTTPPTDDVQASRRPRCCPEQRCTPVHLLMDGDARKDDPGESFVCFGAAPDVEFVYDGVRHANDTRSCHYSPLKGLIAYQENAEDWEALRAAYGRAISRLPMVRADRTERGLSCSGGPL